MQISPKNAKKMLQGKVNKYVLECFWHEGFGTF
jgi:hypothetical protein